MTQQDPWHKTTTNHAAMSFVVVLRLFADILQVKTSGPLGLILVGLFSNPSMGKAAQPNWSGMKQYLFATGYRNKKKKKYTH